MTLIFWTPEVIKIPVSQQEKFVARCKEEFEKIFDRPEIRWVFTQALNNIAREFGPPLHGRNVIQLDAFVSKSAAPTSRTTPARFLIPPHTIPD